MKIQKQVFLSFLTISIGFVLGGGLLAGTARSDSDPLTSLPDNTALDLGQYTCTPPVGADYCAGSITDYSGFTYDSNNHQMLMFGGGHATTFVDYVEVFDFTTLAWNPAYETTPCAEMTTANLDSDRGAWITNNHPYSRHTYDQLVFSPSTNEFLLLHPGAGSGYCEDGPDWYPAGRVGHYDPIAKTWSYGASMSNSWYSYGTAEYDPVSGLVILVDHFDLWTYDPVSMVKNRRIQSNSGHLEGYANNLVYFPPNDKFYYIARGSPTRVWEITLDRTDWGNTTLVELTNMSGDIPNSQESGWAYDTVNQIIGGGIRDGAFYAFNPLDGSWVSRVIQVQPPGGQVGTQAFHALDYDPVTNVFIFITEYSSGRRTWAYRYAARDAAIDLSLTKTAHPNPGVSSQPFTYTLQIRNNGTLTATNVVLTDTLPASVTFSAAAATQGTCIEVTGTVTCQLGDLVTSAGVTATIAVTPTVSGLISNSANVSAQEVDPNPGDNLVTFVSYIFEVAPLRTYMPRIIKGS
jgi:uncharacterized repeat protein (TIGR01451 family)